MIPSSHQKAVLPLQPSSVLTAKQATVLASSEPRIQHSLAFLKHSLARVIEGHESGHEDLWPPLNSLRNLKSTLH
jgi:hypothetical protein